MMKEKLGEKNEHFHASASCTTKVLAEMKACRVWLGLHVLGQKLNSTNKCWKQF